MAIMTTSQARREFLCGLGYPALGKSALRTDRARDYHRRLVGHFDGRDRPGLNKFVQDKVESLGSRTYFVSRFPPRIRSIALAGEHSHPEILRI